ncbi:FAD/NAD(P)-binding domain-containing protein [Durotheca rogersii]|uniref:FAD/NAD(P)-binding domain-containing protein n=1 Tax=Durotheca rogersii TaxID=419775 RepID=UPI00222090E4|nr:FAD/NAD(P)-binding domain-containing protein [Durotheca rogersii]KAI5859822.1 FAD/NAD(P)-binding domain-containing protein [Durotheca rogersii]
MAELQVPTADAPLLSDFDVLTIGAGISGINTAYHLQTEFPGTSYAILEARDSIGGTWDFFRYPGLRSDSDMVTFGFPWSPWTSDQRTGTGSQIVAYIRKAAEAQGIDKNIRFNHKVLAADWSTPTKAWTVTAVNGAGETRTFRSRFLVLGTGYYDYENALEADIPGLRTFGGQVIHTQFWPEDFDYTGKDIVVIGSGATAVTLIPVIAEKAKSVTMLQRSPTYMVSPPARMGPESGLSRLLLRLLPTAMGHWYRRMRSALFSSFLYAFCIAFPTRARASILKATAAQLPGDIPVDPHFNPQYMPWEQRMCVCPGGDFFAALRSGRARVVTDRIAEVTATEIRLASKGSQPLRPDVIVTATGLRLKFAGGVALSVDSEVVDPTTRYVWRGCMVEGVPNLAFVMGYINTSWTLATDVFGRVLTRVMRLTASRGATSVTPRLRDRDRKPGQLRDLPVFALTSTFMKKANESFPRAGGGIWDHRRSYLTDELHSRFGDVKSGLYFE